MAAATRLARTARGDLARLVAVIAVFAGLVLAHGMQCSSTMDATVSAGHVCAGGVVHDNDVLAAAGMVHDQAQAGIGTRISTDPGAPTAAGVAAVLLVAVPDAPGSGGLLVSCLALVIGVVVMAVFAGLRPGLRWIRALAPSRRRIALLSVVQPRAVSLAELCLLRT